MGRAVIYDLVRSPHVDKILLLDKNEAPITEVLKHYEDEKIVPCKLDVTQFPEIVRVLSDYDVAISCVPDKHNFELAKSSLEAGTSFVDLGGNEETLAKEEILDDLAKERGVAIIPECGLAPGLVSILASAAAESLDEIYEIRIRVGGIPAERELQPLNYSISFSTDSWMDEYVNEATIIRHGELVRVPALADLEPISFPAPFGELEAFITSGGVSTLPKTFGGKVQNLDYKTIRYPGHCEKIQLLKSIGLFDSSPVKVNSGEVVPRALLTEKLNESIPHDEPDVVLLRVKVTGIKDKKPWQVVWEGIDFMDQAAKLTAMMRMTAFPASIIAQMIGRGDISEKGTLFPERAVPVKLFLAEVAGRGIRLSVKEGDPEESSG